MIRTDQVIAGNFRIDGHIGSGATGHVYEAEQLSMERHVALKILRAELTDDPEFAHRFRREAKTLGKLSRDPHIVQVFDLIDTEELMAIVMEYIDGDSLGERLRSRGGLPGAEGLRVLRSVAKGLDHAHRGGLLHRDIKPHNILLERGGPGVWLADFGLVKPADGTALTRTDRQMGTLPYMAGELLRGRSATRATDLYAFAVTAYSTLAGGLPFPGSNDLSVRAQDVRERPPIALLPTSDAAAATYTALARALSADPGERHASANELVDELEAGLALDPMAASRTPAFEQDRGALPSRQRRDEDADEPTRVDDAGTALSLVEPLTEHELVDIVDDEPAPPITPVRAPVERAPRLRRRVAIASALSAVVLSAGTAAALMGGDNHGTTPPPAATPERFSAGAATFQAAAGTRAADRPNAIAAAALPGLKAPDPLAAIGTVQKGIALTTISHGTTPLVPASTAKRASARTAGGQVDRYTHGGITTVIAQTPDTIVRLGCTDASADCERAIRTLQLGDGQTLQADPITDVTTRLTTALQRPRDSRLRLPLPAQDLARRQARARSIADAYRSARDAAAELARARPRDSDLAALPRELGDVADAFTDIAAAADNRSAPGDRRARAALTSADAALRTRRARLTARGYSLPWPATTAPTSATIKHHTTTTKPATTVTPTQTNATTTQMPDVAPNTSSGSSGTSTGSGGSSGGSSSSSDGCGTALGPC